jgi:hypothetical protein
MVPGKVRCEVDIDHLLKKNHKLGFISADFIKLPLQGVWFAL